MPLLTFWRASQESKNQILGMNIQQIIAITGNGVLKDGSETSIELREYLSEVESEKLSEYARYCANNAFTDSGQVLQDLVNEIGRRLDFNVENGRYRGVKNEIGFDGIWSTTNQNLIIEVKTTVAYSIDLETPIAYRDKLFEQGRVKKDTPILFVIGRDDTSSLEAQVRGSKHAWSIRIIGIDALAKLMEVNLSTSGKDVTEKIHTILRPIEYTRIDAIVDVVFATAEDKELQIDPIESVESIDTGVKEDLDSTTQDRTPVEIIAEKKNQIIQRFSEKLGKPLQKKRNSMYADIVNQTHAVIAISKRYERKDSLYWYAYHNDPQRKFLSESVNGYMIFGMTDKKIAIAVPFEILEKQWGNLMGTVVKKSNREYKHIFIYEINEKYYLRVREVGSEIDLTQYIL